MSQIKIIELLKEYEPYNKVEKKYLAQTLELLLHKRNDPLDRTIYNPGHITGSAMIVNKPNNKILLIYHSKLGRWLQPGGHAKSTEKSPIDIAVREIQEETGVTLRHQELILLDIDVHEIPFNKKEPSHFHYDFRFLAYVDDPPVHAATDAIKVEWFSFEQAKSITNDVGINRMIEKIMRLEDV